MQRSSLADHSQDEINCVTGSNNGRTELELFLFAFVGRNSLKKMLDTFTSYESRKWTTIVYQHRTVLTPSIRLFSVLFSLGLIKYIWVDIYRERRCLTRICMSRNLWGKHLDRWSNPINSPCEFDNFSRLVAPNAQSVARILRTVLENTVFGCQGLNKFNRQ